MYGVKGRYFGGSHENFQNTVWIELIGFDNTKSDFGVQDYIDTIGFVPDMISLHLTSVDFANNHRGMEREYRLPVYACSYGGHANNDDRARQDWTNYQLRGLVRELKSHNIKAFFSFFDLDYPTGLDDLPLFSDLHPELIARCTNPEEHERGILMIKRFADGSYYEDYLLKKLIETAKDYELDGIQLADGISVPRNAIWFADFTSDIIEQTGIEVPENEDAAKWINRYKRRELMDFYRRRWTGFMVKMIRRLKKENISVTVLSAWGRDPLEAIYRYGVNYSEYAAAGADAVIVQDVSADLAILGYEDNHNYYMDYERRRFVHSEFLANLMCIKAHLGSVPLLPLFMLWDNMEQWDVIHHTPTAMQRAAAANFNHFCLVDGKYEPVTNGPHFCLGDALKPGDWEFVKLCWDNGYTESVNDIPGATFIWSAKRMENEIDGVITRGLTHSAMWLAHLLRHGAQISKIANISDIEQISGNIIVANPSFLPEGEAEAVRMYDRGRVFYLESVAAADVSEVTNPKKSGWPRPLDFAPIDESLIHECVCEINSGLVNLSWGAEECHVWEVATDVNTSRVFVENEEYYYVLPEVSTTRPIKAIKIITKPEGYPLKFDEYSFKLRVPPRGLDIAEIVWGD